ncbi:hypothetical protein MNV49_002004 [Pseudohyphozyma bogoriensis]|nr:hypothetical protein MNV49_002004 [Pseudohyphozyma bogoriensis]
MEGEDEQQPGGGPSDYQQQARRLLAAAFGQADAEAPSKKRKAGRVGEKEQKDSDKVKDKKRAPKSTGFQALHNSFASLSKPETCTKTPAKPQRLAPLPLPPAPISEPRQDTKPSDSLRRTDANAVAGPSREAVKQFGSGKKARPMHKFDTFAAQLPPGPGKPPPPLQKLPAFPLPPAAETTKSKRVPKKPLMTPPKPIPLDRASSPQKPLLDTPVSARASFLFNALPPPKGQVESGTRLLESVPPAPPPDWDAGETEDGAEAWSPTKKKAGYTITGLASRASAALSSARTDHTLWLHTLSRTLTDQFSHLTRPLLDKLLQPAIRLLVLETLPLGAGAGSAAKPWEESRTILTRCRLILTHSSSDTTSDSHVLEADMEGLVLFSLNANPPPTGISFGAAQPPRRKRPKSTESVTIYVPTGPHDLRLVEENAEIWCWDPCYETPLPDKLGPPLEVGGRFGVAGEERSGVEEIVMDARSEEEKEWERTLPLEDFSGVEIWRR